MYKNVQGCINMFVESEVDEKTDFNPIDEFLYSYPPKICKKCKNYEHCPLWYQCPSLMRWLRNADLDDDNTDI